MGRVWLHARMHANFDLFSCANYTAREILQEQSRFCFPAVAVIIRQVMYPAWQRGRSAAVQNGVSWRGLDVCIRRYEACFPGEVTD